MRRSSAITPLGGGTNELLIETLAMMAYPVHAAGKYPHHWRKISSILRHFRASGTERITSDSVTAYNRGIGADCRPSPRAKDGIMIPTPEAKSYFSELPQSG
jgi:hypothetical protein